MIGARIKLLIAGLLVSALVYPQSNPGGPAYVPTQIVAGTNVTISPTSGLGKVTINATGGGSGNVSTTGSPTSGFLAAFSGTASITSGNLSGDCTTTGTLAVTCLKTNNVSFGTFATQNYATPPVIGGTTPAAASFTTLQLTGLPYSQRLIAS